ncbi:AAA family ATPase [Vibrio cholerae]|nr:AAA family ATPase [Vibrio cholerae]EKF9117170.1 AAA family ATPase [Vibrio cholerae]
MIIKNFVATNVHGYLDFNIKFRDDINFLVGHNGSGKTTALKLITAILGPDLKFLASVPFDSCIVEFVHSHKSNKNKDEKVSSKHNSIRVTKTDENLTFNTTLNDSPVTESFSVNNILQGADPISEILSDILKLTNPILISLDRKFNNKRMITKSGVLNLHVSKWAKDRDDSIEDPIATVKDLISNEVDRINKIKSSEDERLKDKILLDAFNVIDCSSDMFFSFSTMYENEDLVEKRNLIQSTLESLNLKDKNLQQVSKATDKFFYELDRNIQEIKKFEHVDSQERFSNENYMSALSFMFSNRAQLIRIDNMVNFIKESHRSKSKLDYKLDVFEKIVNSFFNQTSKKISIKTGVLKIIVKGKDVEVESLSSGETQIITLFAHILFNRRMVQQAVFMIDEPELSLHLAWQEMFVDSLKAANPELQVILATHSPAIIKGMDEQCVFVN